MLSRSSKFSLLTGVSAAVLATGFGVSGALAQQAPNFQSSTDDVWADGAARNGVTTEPATAPVTGTVPITDISRADAGDNLEILSNTVTINNTSGNQHIGVLKGGAAGAKLEIKSAAGNVNVIANIGSIVKSGAAAVDLSVNGADNSGALLGAIVAGDATVRNLTIDMSAATAANGAAASNMSRAGHNITIGGNLITEGATQIKVGQNTAAPIDATLRLNGQTTTLGGQVTLDDGADPEQGRASLIVSGRNDQTISSAAGATHRIVGGANGEGTIKILNGNVTTRNNGAPNKATFNVGLGAGATNMLGQLIVGDSDKGGHAVFSKEVFVNDISVYGGNDQRQQGIAEFSADVTSDRITLNGGNAIARFNNGNDPQLVLGNITTDRRGSGAVDVNNSGSGTVQFSGTIGAPVTINGSSVRRDLGLITVRDGKANFDGDIYADNIEVTSADGTTFARNITGNLKLKAANAEVTLDGAGDQEIDGTIKADGGNNRGELTVNKTSAGDRVTFKENVGETGAALKTITLTQGIAQFNKDVRAQSMTVTSAGGGEFKGATIALENGLTFNAADAKITLNGTDNQTFTGEIKVAAGQTRGLLVVNNTGAAGNGGGIPEKNRVTFRGGLGTSTTQRLKTITVEDGIADFANNVFVQKIEANSTDGIEFKGNVTVGTATGDAAANSGLTFGGNNDKVTLNGAGNQTFTGDITAGADNRGLLVVNNTGTTNNRVTFKGNIGASAANDLQRITLKDGVTELRGNVFANQIVVEAGSDGLVFNGKNNSGRGPNAAQQTVSGAVTTDTNNSGAITITSAAGVIFNGQVGAGPTTPGDPATAKQFGEISVGSTTAAGKATFNEDVFTRTLKISGATGRESEVTIKKNLTGNVELAGTGDTAKLIIGGTEATGSQDHRILDGSITVAGPGQGEVEVNLRPGGTHDDRMTFKGQIGTQANALGTLNLVSTGQGVRFEQKVYANSITVDSAQPGGGSRSKAPSNLEFDGNALFLGDVTFGTEFIVRRNVAFRGNVTADNSGRTGFKFTPSTTGSQTGAAANPTVSFSGADPQTFTGTITTDSVGEGRLDVLNSSGVTFKNDLGTRAAKLDKLDLGNNAKATLEGSAHFANDSTLGTNATLTIGGAGRATNTTTEQRFSGNFTGAGTIVVDNRSTHDDGKKVIFNDNVTVANVTLTKGTTTFNGVVGDGGGDRLTIASDAGATTFNGNVNTSITTSSAGGLTFNQASSATANQTIAGNVTLNAGNATFNNASTTKTQTINSKLTLGNDGTELTFTGAGNQTVTAQVDIGASDNRGVIVVNKGGGRVTFNTGLGTSATNDLNEIRLTDGQAEFNNAVFVDTLNVNAGSDRAQFDAAVTANNITVDAGASNTDFNSSVTTTGANASFILKANTTFAGDVTAGGDNGLRFGGAATATFDGAAGQTITGNITTSAPEQGTLTVNNTGTGLVQFTGNVGDATNDLGQITLTNGQSQFDGNVFANNIAINTGDAADSTTFAKNVTVGQNLTTSANAATTFSGVVTVGGNATLRAGTTTFGDAVTVEGTFTLAGTTNFAGNVTANGTGGLQFNAATGTATFNGTSGAQTVTGALTSAVTGGGNHGQITVSNSAGVTFTGALGADTPANTRLKSVTVTGNATAAQAAKATFNGAVYLNEGLNVGQNATATFDGVFDTNQGVTTGAGATTAFNGTVRADNATLGQRSNTTFGGALEVNDGVSGGDLTLNASATATFDNTVDVNGELTLNAGVNATFEREVTVNGNVNVDGAATITLGDAFGNRSGAAANTAFITTTTGNITGLTNKLTVNLPGTVGLGMQKLFSKTVTPEQQGNVAFNGRNGHIKHVLGTDGVLENKIAIGADTATKYGISRDQGRVVEQAWEAIKNDPTLIAALTKAGGAGAAGQRKFAQQVFPQTSAIGGATAATLNVGGQVAGVFSDRLSAVRGSGAQRGFATGGHGLDKSFWLKPFGGWGQQSNNKTFAGYSTQSYGLATGFDGAIGDKSRLGVALAYSTSNIKGKGAGQDKTSVKNGSLSVYGGYTGNNYYVEGSVGYGLNDIETDSKVLTMTRKASYDTDLMSASVGAGVPVSVRGGGFVTPTAGVAWSRVGAASYTTTGAQKLNQKISVGSIDTIVGSVGAKVHKRIKRAKGTFVPSARLGVSYDFAGERTTAKGRFTGGGNAFKVKGAKANQFAGTAGVGLSFEGRKWSVGADYDLDTRSGYTGHAARVNAKLKF